MIKPKKQTYKHYLGFKFVFCFDKKQTKIIKK